MAYVLSMWLLMFGAVPEPRVLSPEPVPGRARIIGRGPSGAWMISYNNSGGPEEEASLRVGGTWQRVPDGTAHEWRDWVVIEGLVALEGRDKLPEGATFSFSFGVLPWFARRVVLVNLRSGQRIDAPWDTLSPQPLGDGTRWLLMRCREATAELMLWTPSTNEAATLATLEADLSTRCKSFGGGQTKPVPAPSATPAGAVLRPFVELEVIRDDKAVPRVNGRVARGGGGSRGSGGSVPLTPSLSSGFAVHDGFLFAEEGVFRLPKGAKVSFVPPGSQ